MEKWSFPSTDDGEIEGYANPGLELFKGNPLEALTREICQNSLDAQSGDRTVIVEFQKYDIAPKDFPGMIAMKDIIQYCDDFWRDKTNKKVIHFLDNAKLALSGPKMCVLRISDFNTKGLSGAYAKGSEITPWIKLVKGNAISTKEGDSAGSYGIGKAAAFVNSAIQTVFYRTISSDDKKAAQGVARLMSFENPYEGNIRRAVGYYGDPEGNMPVGSISQLDKIFMRTTAGTDVFIPAFTGFTSDGKWVKKMICEVLENFLISIYSKKLIVKIQDKEINADKISQFIAQNDRSAKDAYCFNKIMISDKEKIITDELDFHGLGKLRLKLLYDQGLNKRILVVRKSGMKISEIPRLPVSISYTGILELEGYELNEFFRDMENPQHTRWEPNRHTEPELAKKYKNEVENWVREKINEHIENIAGAESDINTKDLFSAAADTTESFSDTRSEEGITDTVQSVDISYVEKKSKTMKKSSGEGDTLENGRVDEFGRSSAIRSHTGGKPLKKGKPGGEADDKGNDQVKKGTRIVKAGVRAVATVTGTYILMIKTTNDIINGKLEILSSGENGKGSIIQVEKAEHDGKPLEIKDGKICIGDVQAEEDFRISFEIKDRKKYSIEVKVYGN